MDGALVAEEPNDIPQNMRQLRKCVIRQLTKEVSSGPDCFLRVFGDYESTLKWAKEWFRLTEGQAESRVQLFKIDPKMLSKSLVFRGADLDQALDVQSDSSARNLLFLDPEEYLVLNRIPDAAISLHAEGCGTLRKRKFDKSTCERDGTYK